MITTRFEPLYTGRPMDFAGGGSEFFAQTTDPDAAFDVDDEEGEFEDEEEDDDEFEDEDDEDWEDEFDEEFDDEAGDEA